MSDGDLMGDDIMGLGEGLDAFDSGAGDLPEFFSMDAHPHSSAQEDVSLGGWEQDPLAHEPQTDEGTPPPHNAGAMAATGGAAMDDQAATGFAAAAAAEYLTPAEIRWKMSEERPLFMEWIKDALVEVHGGTRDGRKLLNLKVPIFDAPPACKQRVPGYGADGWFDPEAVGAIYVVWIDGGVGVLGAPVPVTSFTPTKFRNAELPSAADEGSLIPLVSSHLSP
ncbi:hypothetical protein T484DRAFT_1815800 [Baffinella frigidus]|nr:hypothetical protein T484DRAFT_1815800 [Cryptophyta sp. CCMP2293]